MIDLIQDCNMLRHKKCMSAYYADVISAANNGKQLNAILKNCLNFCVLYGIFYPKPDEIIQNPTYFIKFANDTRRQILINTLDAPKGIIAYSRCKNGCSAMLHQNAENKYLFECQCKKARVIVMIPEINDNVKSINLYMIYKIKGDIATIFNIANHANDEVRRMWRTENKIATHCDKIKLNEVIGKIKKDDPDFSDLLDKAKEITMLKNTIDKVNRIVVKYLRLCKRTMLQNYYLFGGSRNRGNPDNNGIAFTKNRNEAISKMEHRYRNMVLRASAYQIYLLTKIISKKKEYTTICKKIAKS